MFRVCAPPSGCLGHLLLRRAGKRYARPPLLTGPLAPVTAALPHLASAYAHFRGRGLFLYLPVLAAYTVALVQVRVNEGFV